MLACCSCALPLDAPAPIHPSPAAWPNEAGESHQSNRVAAKREARSGQADSPHGPRTARGQRATRFPGPHFEKYLHLLLTRPRPNGKLCRTFAFAAFLTHMRQPRHRGNRHGWLSFRRITAPLHLLPRGTAFAATAKVARSDEHVSAPHRLSAGERDGARPALSTPAAARTLSARCP